MTTATLKQRIDAVSKTLRNIKGDTRQTGQFQRAARHLKDAKMFDSRGVIEAAWDKLFMAEGAALGAEAIDVSLRTVNSSLDE